MLLNHSEEIYVIHDTPHHKKDPNQCLLSNFNYNLCYSVIGVNASYNLFPIYHSKKVHYINMIKYICENSSKCYYMWNSMPIYIDDNHLSLRFTIKLSKQLLTYIYFKKQIYNFNVNCNGSYVCSYRNLFI